MLTLGAWYVNALAASFLLVSIFMMLVILIQKPKGGGRWVRKSQVHELTLMV